MNLGHSQDIKLLHLADSDWKPSVSSSMDMDVFPQAERKKNTIENHKASQGFMSGGKAWRSLSGRTGISSFWHLQTSTLAC